MPQRSFLSLLPLPIVSLAGRFPPFLSLLSHVSFLLISFLAFTFPRLSFLFLTRHALPALQKLRGQSKAFPSYQEEGMLRRPGASCQGSDKRGESLGRLSQRLALPTVKGPFPLVSKNPSAQSVKSLDLPRAQPHQQGIRRDSSVAGQFLPRRQQMERTEVSFRNFL